MPWMTVAASALYLADDQVVECECRTCDVRWTMPLGDARCWMCGSMRSTCVRRLDPSGVDRRPMVPPPHEPTRTRGLCPSAP